jgi:preprotein translocase subunit YajC
VAAETNIAVKDEEGKTSAAALTSTEQAPYELTVDKMLMDTLVFLFLLFSIFYFLLIRPQQKRLNEHKAMLGTMKKGSRVLTGGGIVGVISKVENDSIVVVEIAPNVKVRVTKESIAEVLDDSKLPADTANDN